MIADKKNQLLPKREVTGQYCHVEILVLICELAERPNTARIEAPNIWRG